MQAVTKTMPGPEMSDDRIARLEGKLDALGDTIGSMATSINRFADTANGLANAMARHDAHSEVQSEVNKNVQLSLKGLADQMQELRVKSERIDANEKAIDQLYSRIENLEERQRVTENAVLVNNTRLNPIWEIGKKAASVLVTMAITGALTAYYMSDK